MVNFPSCCPSCPDFSGKYTNNAKQQVRMSTNRGCTDIAFLIAYIVFWGVFIFSAAQAKTMGGNPDKIIKGIDYLGRICGVDAGVENKTLAAWPYVPEPEVKICVESCQETSIPGNKWMVWEHSSTEYYGYCFPFPNGTVNVQINVTMTGDFLGWWNGAGLSTLRAVGDVSLCTNMFIVSIFLSLVVSFMFVNGLRYVAGTLMMVCTCVIIFAGIFMGMMMFYYARQIDDNFFLSVHQERFFRYSAYITWILTGLFAVVMVFLRTQVMIAVEVVKEASRAMLDMKQLILLPIVPLTFISLYLVLWITEGLWIYSVSDLQTIEMPPGLLVKGGFFGVGPSTRTPYPETLKKFVRDDEYMMVYGLIHVFHGFWTIQFISYISYATMAGALASWYFTPRDEKGKKEKKGEDSLYKWPVLASFWRTMRYHTGTIALAAFIIAVIQTLRVIVRYIERKLKNGGKPSAVAQALLRILQCVLRCAECCMDKINKNSIVWMCIYGNTFCVSTCSAFALIWRNLFRLAAVNTVSLILLQIGKITVAICTMTICGTILAYAPWYKENLSAPTMPALVIFFMSYVVARAFMQIFESVIDATFFCFLVDVENNEKGQMLAHIDLQKLVGKYQAKKKPDIPLESAGEEEEEEESEEESEEEEKPKKKSHKKPRESAGHNNNNSNKKIHERDSKDHRKKRGSKDQGAVRESHKDHHKKRSTKDQGGGARRASKDHGNDHHKHKSKHALARSETDNIAVKADRERHHKEHDRERNIHRQSEPGGHRKRKSTQYSQYAKNPKADSRRDSLDG